MLDYPLRRSNADLFAHVTSYAIVHELSILSSNVCMRIAAGEPIPRGQSRLAVEKANLKTLVSEHSWLDALCNAVGFTTTGFILAWFDYDPPALNDQTERGDELRRLIVCDTKVRDALLMPSSQRIANLGEHRLLLTTSGQRIQSSNEVLRKHREAFAENEVFEMSRLSALRGYVAERMMEVYATRRGSTVRLPNGNSGEKWAIDFKYVLEGLRKGWSETKITNHYGVPNSAIRRAKATFEVADIKY